MLGKKVVCVECLGKWGGGGENRENGLGNRKDGVGG